MLGRRISEGAALAIILSLVPVAAAQRPDDVAAASSAFREGQSAQLAGDYARAAELFELADDTAPSPAALRSAIRNRQAAGQAARAATLAAEALERYPADAETRTLADAVLAELSPTLGAFALHCAIACTIAIDGRAVHEDARTAVDVFLDPGAHTLVASWAGRDPVTRAIDVVAGTASTVELEAPALAITVATVDPMAEVRAAPDEPPSSRSGGMTPVVFGIGAGLTAVGAGVLMWSGIDVLAARDAYVASPTEAGYNDGVGRELRTNVALGITAGLGAATLVVAFFTDFGGGSGAPRDGGGAVASIRPTLVLGPESGALGVAGTF